MISLPWLTQQNEVSLRSAGSEALPFFDTPHHVVEMSFHPEGKTHEGVFRLYIDPETYRLRGFSQTARYPFLPGDVFPQDLSAGGMSNMFRVIETYANVDGLVLPRSYSTIVVREDGMQLMGSHLVLQPSFENPLPEQSLTKPDGARVMSERNPG